MLESKVNAKSTHSAIEATIDPFEALERMPGAMEPKTPMFPGRGDTGRGTVDFSFDAEILYARRAADSGRHPELSRLEVKFQKTIVGFLYTIRPGRVALQCDTDGHKSVLECDLSYQAQLILPNLREPCGVDPIPDLGIYGVTDDPKKPGYIVDPDKGTCGCQIIFEHDFECRHLKAVLKYQAENIEGFQKKTPADYPKVENTPETPVVESKVTSEGKPPEVTEETPLLAPPDVMSDLVAKHHPTSLAALETNGAQEVVYCAVCSRELTNPTSRRAQLGPVCREKVGMRGEGHLREDVVSERLLCATRIYKDAKFQQWVLQGCLQLDAPVPKMVIKQKKTEYWGLKRSPYLYYLSKDNKAHCLYKSGKELKYKRITATSRDNELDQMAWREAKEEYIDNGGTKLRTILL